MIEDAEFEYKPIHIYNDYEYGFSANGRNCGNGYDVAIKRISEYQGILNISYLAIDRGIDWFGLIKLYSKYENLQKKALSIANSPDLIREFTWWMSINTDKADDEDRYCYEYEAIANIWNSIELI